MYQQRHRQKDLERNYHLPTPPKKRREKQTYHRPFGDLGSPIPANIQGPVDTGDARPPRRMCLIIELVGAVEGDTIAASGGRGPGTKLDLHDGIAVGGDLGNGGDRAPGDHGPAAGQGVDAALSPGLDALGVVPLLDEAGGHVLVVELDADGAGAGVLAAGGAGVRELGVVGEEGDLGEGVVDEARVVLEAEVGGPAVAQVLEVVVLAAQLPDLRPVLATDKRQQAQVPRRDQVVPVGRLLDAVLVEPVPAAAVRVEDVPVHGLVQGEVLAGPPREARLARRDVDLLEGAVVQDAVPGPAGVAHVVLRDLVVVVDERAAVVGQLELVAVGARVERVRRRDVGEQPVVLVEHDAGARPPPEEVVARPERQVGLPRVLLQVGRRAAVPLRVRVHQAEVLGREDQRAAGLAPDRRRHEDVRLRADEVLLPRVDQDRRRLDVGRVVGLVRAVAVHAVVVVIVFGRSEVRLVGQRPVRPQR